MGNEMLIRDIYAREILDSGGNAAIEVEVLAGSDTVGTASVPSGISAGREKQGTEQQERPSRGMNMEQAVEMVNSQVAPAVIGRNILDQEEMDRELMRAAGKRGSTDGIQSLERKALLGVSMAVARAAAEALKVPLYRYFGGVRAKNMPVPMISVLDGGCHADNYLDIAGVLIVPAQTAPFHEQLMICTEVYRELQQVLTDRGCRTCVGTEGGFAPELKDIKEAVRLIRDAVEQAGYGFGQDIKAALDVRASALYDRQQGVYSFPGESRRQGREIVRDTDEMIRYYEELISEFPICSLTDPLDREDWKGWKDLTARLGGRIQLAGDELFAGSPQKLSRGIREGAANAVVLKAGQTGTLTEMFRMIRAAQEGGYGVILSHRYTETEDTMIADIAAAFGAGWMKAGAPSRMEGTSKYNRLLRIEEKLSEKY